MSVVSNHFILHYVSTAQVKKCYFINYTHIWLKAVCGMPEDTMI
jgi:hypothetical protein